jgi:adenylate cyclase
MKKAKPLVLVIISMVVFILSIALSQIGIFQNLELKTIDWRFEWRGPLNIEDSPVVLITIDDESFDILPERWPWPRSYYAYVIENLSQAGASVIGLDVILDIPDIENPKNDSMLAQAIDTLGNVVLTGKIEQSSRLKSYYFQVKPIQLFLSAADGSWGLGSIQVDDDGFYRRYIVAQEHRGEYLPSFALEILKKYKNYNGKIDYLMDENTFSINGVKIPLYDQGTILINYAGPASTFPRYSFNSVIDDTSFNLGIEDLDYFDQLLKDEVFKNKIVLIGSTVSELHDNFPTPYLSYKDSPREMPGVEIHANAINTILNNLFFKKLNYLVTLLIALFLILLVQFFSIRFSTALSAIFTIILTLLFISAVFYLFMNQLFVLEMILPVMAVLFSFVGNNLYQYIITQREKQMIIGAFERYVPEGVVKDLLKHPEKLSLGGEERFITVLFSDIAGFTTISEKLPPQELVNLINEYLSEMTDIILNHDGIIDKYEGDAIMAEFGVPIFYEDHAIKACLAAIDMQKRLNDLSEKWVQEGLPALRSRIGINSGNMIVGNMGSNKVFDYTALGDEVNLASRLEGANKSYGTSIMISDSTNELVKEKLLTRPLDLIRVKGKQKPVQVFELISKKLEGREGLNIEIVSTYTNGIQYYHKRDWQQASECFRFCLKKNPGDIPSRIYLKRIIEHVKNPPPPDWDGVYTLKSK